jgi:hypothetical protein
MHFGEHLRVSFRQWVYDGMPPEAACEERYEPVMWPAEKLLGLMTHCTDTMPGDICHELDVELGSSYARAAQRLLSERKRLRVVQ